MALRDIQICSRALIKIGAQPISGFADGSAESIVAASLYPSTRDALLSAYPWSFATAQRELPRVDGRPAADYQFAYQLPADFLRVLSAGTGGAGRGLVYRIAERRLHSNAAQVTLTYLFRPHEATFPPFFDQVLIQRMAAEFCLPITESGSRAEALYRLAEQEFRRARLIDAQQDMPAGFEDFSLVEARR